MAFKVIARRNIWRYNSLAAHRQILGGLKLGSIYFVFRSVVPQRSKYRYRLKFLKQLLRGVRYDQILREFRTTRNRFRAQSERNRLRGTVPNYGPFVFLLRPIYRQNTSRIDFLDDFYRESLLQTKAICQPNSIDILSFFFNSKLLYGTDLI